MEIMKTAILKEFAIKDSKKSGTIASERKIRKVLFKNNKERELQNMLMIDGNDLMEREWKWVTEGVKFLSR